MNHVVGDVTFVSSRFFYVRFSFQLACARWMGLIFSIIQEIAGVHVIRADIRKCCCNHFSLHSDRSTKCIVDSYAQAKGKHRELEREKALKPPINTFSRWQPAVQHQPKIFIFYPLPRLICTRQLYKTTHKGAAAIRCACENRVNRLEQRRTHEQTSRRRRRMGRLRHCTIRVHA